MCLQEDDCLAFTPTPKPCVSSSRQIFRLAHCTPLFPSIWPFGRGCVCIERDESLRGQASGGKGNVEARSISLVASVEFTETYRLAK